MSQRDQLTTLDAGTSLSAQPLLMHYGVQPDRMDVVMRRSYQIICHIVTGLVVVQAALIAWGAFAIGHDLGNGAGVTEDTDVLGFDVHGVIGQYVIPVLVLVLLVVALIARAGVKWAAWLLLAVVVQVALAYISFGIAWVGFVHGVVAFAVAGLAETAARSVAVRPERARTASAAGPASPAG